MVTRLPFPQSCSLTLVDAVVAERAHGVNAAYFAGLAIEWRTRVEHYLAERGNPETVATWPTIMAKATSFRTLYGKPGENSSQKPVIEKLRERKLKFCPSCGEEGTPNTLDHYLPQEHYPHFVVTPANLTPMCDACQSAKGTRTTDHHGKRIFLHPYYDDFLVMRVLHLVIGRPFDAPTNFVLQPDPDLPVDIAHQVQRHIDGMELQQRYGSFFRDEYIRLLRLTQEARETEGNIRSNIELFKRMHELRAVNLWPHIFYAAVLADEELLDFLENGDLPELL